LNLPGFVKGHPVWFVVGLEGAVLVSAAPRIDRFWSHVAPPADPAAVARLILAVGLVVGLTWRRRCGFVRPSRWRDPYLLFLLGLPLALPAMALIPPNFPSLHVALTLALGTLIVAANEELIFRGLMLQALLPFGPRRAVFATGLLFGLTHIPNAFLGANASFVVLQATAAVVVGIFFAALTLRIHSVLPVILAHWFNDWAVFSAAGLGVSRSAPAVDAFIVAMLVGYAAVLLGAPAIILRRSMLNRCAAPQEP
jgi:membrane protease YdiL (CAAX protease family)